VTREEARKYRLWPFFLPGLLAFLCIPVIFFLFPDSGFAFLIPGGVVMVLSPFVYGEVCKRQSAYLEQLKKERE
jgi:predicted membrane channel-forming protein YqfA (hemolysin III family)